MSRALRVLVADDQAPFRKAARTVLEVTCEYEVVGEVTSGEEAVDAIEALAPDVVLMDVKMGGIGGIEATRRILAARPETLVVLVSSYREEDVPASAAESGAVAFVSKDRFNASTLTTLLSSPPKAPAPRGRRERPSRDD